MTRSEEMLKVVSDLTVAAYFHGKHKESGEEIDQEAITHYLKLQQDAIAKLKTIADSLDNPFSGDYIDTIILGVHYHEYIASTGQRVLVEVKVLYQLKLT